MTEMTLIKKEIESARRDQETSFAPSGAGHRSLAQWRTVWDN